MYCQISKAAPSNNSTKFIKNKPIPNILAGTVYHIGMANSFRMFGSEANLIKGTKAKGSYILYRILRKLSS